MTLSNESKQCCNIWRNMTFPVTRWFKKEEFRRPEMMNVAFILWLDLVRDRSKVPMVITDDGRLPGDVPSGASLTSLHFEGRAVDIRSRNWSYEQKWALVEAIVFYANQAPGKIELELVYDEQGDKHWHIGVSARAGAQHKLLEKDD